MHAELTLADKALAAKDFEVAYQGYSDHASNNALAQFTLGLIEQQGWGRPANAVAACTWFDKAAAQHVPAAAQFVGDCFANGIGRAVDGLAAIRWYSTAAEAGIAYADCLAGDLYIAGAIVPKDVQRGLSMCTAAAQAESTPAMVKLANYYHYGNLVPVNLRLARFWYDQAAQRHHHESQFQLGMMLSQGEGGPADMPKARFWLEHAAMEGYAPAYLPTAILYANAAPDPKTGALSPNDLAKVYMWNKVAAASTENPVQLAEIARIDALASAVMPSQWRPELDRRVADHLAAHVAQSPK